MNNYAKIRALIPDADSAKYPHEIRALLPDVKAQQIRSALCEMIETGVIDRTGNKSDGYKYFVIRTPKLKAYATPEESRQAKLARDRAYAKARGPRIGTRKAGVRPLAEYREHLARQRGMTEQRRAEENAARREQWATKRTGERAATVQAVASKRATRTLAQRLLANEPHESVRLRDSAPVKQVPKETVSEWMARTGQRPQVLPVAWNEARGM